eukprot:3069400-Pyramimonas_sp.AAC.1
MPFLPCSIFSLPRPFWVRGPGEASSRARVRLVLTCVFSVSFAKASVLKVGSGAPAPFYDLLPP